MMNGDVALLGTYLWFFLAAAGIFLVLAPFLIWKNTANTTALLARLLEEQERTNDLFSLLLKERSKAQPAPEHIENNIETAHGEHSASTAEFKLEDD